MSKRLQVIFDDEELRDIQRAARKQSLTTAEWVRQALRRAQRTQPRVDDKKKLSVVQAATEHDFPTADIDRMLAEIERGYLHDGPA